jgi:hypothetical protein
MKRRDLLIIGAVLLASACPGVVVGAHPSAPPRISIACANASDNFGQFTETLNNIPAIDWNMPDIWVVQVTQADVLLQDAKKVCPSSFRYPLIRKAP